jgi:hypothetical protein
MYTTHNIYSSAVRLSLQPTFDPTTLVRLTRSQSSSSDSRDILVFSANVQHEATLGMTLYSLEHLPNILLILRQGIHGKFEHRLRYAV